jgi:hypothetical protein
LGFAGFVGQTDGQGSIPTRGQRDVAGIVVVGRANVLDVPVDDDAVVREEGEGIGTVINHLRPGEHSDDPVSSGFSRGVDDHVVVRHEAAQSGIRHRARVGGCRRVNGDVDRIDQERAVPSVRGTRADRAIDEKIPFP